MRCQQWAYPPEEHVRRHRNLATRTLHCVERRYQGDTVVSEHDRLVCDFCASVLFTQRRVPIETATVRPPEATYWTCAEVTQ